LLHEIRLDFFFFIIILILILILIIIIIIIIIGKTALFEKRPSLRKL
jgi:hypothetical protein